MFYPFFCEERLTENEIRTELGLFLIMILIVFCSVRLWLGVLNYGAWSAGKKRERIDELFLYMIRPFRVSVLYVPFSLEEKVENYIQS